MGEGCGKMEVEGGMKVAGQDGMEWKVERSKNSTYIRTYVHAVYSLHMLCSTLPLFLNCVALHSTVQYPLARTPKKCLEQICSA